MQRIIPILTIALLISVSSVLSTFAQQEPQFFGGQIGAPSNPDTVILSNAFQGTNTLSPNNVSAEAFLKWKQIFQDGTEEGTTDPMATFLQAFTGLTFVPEEQPLRTLVEAQVIVVIDVSQIGSKKCYEIARWNLEQSVFVNGRAVTIPKSRIIPEGLDEGTQIFEQAGLTFSPNLIKRLLEIQGITLKTGDKVIWKVDASYRFSTFNGQVFTDSRNVTKCLGFFDTGIVGYGFGFTTQMTFTWVDPTVFIITPTTTEPDLDGDGIPDSIDQCDFQPETFNGFQDSDGCPDDDPIEFVMVFVDTDGDGILDVDDLCPTQGEIFNGIDDTDGCPDGAVLGVNFASIPIDEPLTSFTPVAGEIQPLTTEEQLQQILTTASQTIGDQTQPTPTGDLDLLEGDPESPLHTTEEPIVITGLNDECNPITQDCDSIIFEAVRDFERAVGIKLPFEPTLLNIILIIGIIVGVILIIMRLKKKI